MDTRKKKASWLTAATLLAPAFAQGPVKVEPVAASPGDSFGYAVDIDGDWMVVGAFRDDTSGLDAGAGYVLRRGDAGWDPFQELFPQNALARGCAGYAVAISNDVLALGAPGPAWENSVLGVVHVFEYDGASWVQTARIENPTGELDDQFGRSLELSGDRLIVGAPHDDSLAPDGGRAYVFDRAAGWGLEAALFTPDVGPSDFLGFSVAIDGDRAMAGAPYDDDMGTNAGAAWIFESSGPAWGATRKLLGSDSTHHDAFGTSVALHRDRALVGAPGQDTGASNAGAAYLFESESGAWPEVARLAASDGATGDSFGISVDLWGLQAVVGASHADRTYSNAGCAYRFYSDDGTWFEHGQIVAGDPRPYSYLGLDVAATWDQSVAGAFLAVDSDGVVTGAAYADENPVPWSETFCACTTGGACGGAQASAGCTNSSGTGAAIEAFGTPSVTAADLGLRLRFAPGKSHTFLLGGEIGPAAPLRSGLLCLGSGKALYLGKTDKTGKLDAAPSSVSLVSAGVFPGDTLGFQFYFEDKKDKCQGWNTSNGLAITFTP